MSDSLKIVRTGQGWFVETPTGQAGPMETQDEANTYLSLMRTAYAAGSETACTEQECFS